MAQKTKNILNSNKHIRNSSGNQILPLTSEVQTIDDDYPSTHLDSAKKQHLDNDSSSQNQQSYMNIQSVTAEI